ncbi:MAG: sulfotransferase [Chloroflexota bacterium]|jgi:hypothetical protein|nr:sulfotransferase [Chloroflexota bacterium]
MNDGPIYIGGLDRSGKTTMQAFLASHPRIAIPYAGSNLWSFFYARYGDLSKEQNFERCLAALLSYSHAVALNPDPDRIRREFRQGPADYARLFALLHKHYAEQQGKPRWGDQSGLIETYAGHLFAADPSAKLIHMVRDPRDRYAASLARAPKGKGRAGGAAARWLYSARLAERNRRRFPDRYLVVRFETMVAQPEQTLRQVCDFLGEEYVPSMLTMDGSPRQRDKLARTAGRAPGTSPLSQDFIGGFRQSLSAGDIAFIQWAAGKKMSQYGYVLDPVAFSAAETLHFWLVNCPANLARMAAWRGREEAHNRLPALLGRRPDRKTLRSSGQNRRSVAQTV